jgi:tetraacyldisaccharide 4'-kinase
LTGPRRRTLRADLLGAAYGRILLMRRAWYARAGRRRRLNHRVISVGNLSLGGSGKTPVVAAVARLLRDRGERPVVLTRGYGRREVTEGVLVVSDGRRVLEPVARSGDEPQLLARTLPGVPVLVCADRYIAGLFAERHFDVTVSILDDGFQHVQLERDIDLLLVPPADLEDGVLPFGRLREPLTAARFSDAVLVPGSDDDVSHVAAELSHHHAFRVVPHYTDVVGLARSGPSARSDEAPGTSRTVVAFAGIARPERFFNALRSLGYEVVGELTFRDHHWYTPRDRETIQSAARDANGALLVTTEKDAMRCDFEVATLPMTVTIEPAADFASWLMSRLTTCSAACAAPSVEARTRTPPSGEGR